MRENGNWTDRSLALLGSVYELAEGLEAPENAPHREGNDAGPQRLVGRINLDLVCGKQQQ